MKSGPPVSKKLVAWTLFDFANSSYSAVIAAVIFPAYFVSVIAGNDKGLGDLWWGRAISISMFIVAFSSPFLGGIADLSGRRKLLLILYTWTAVACVALFALTGKGSVFTAVVLVVIANIGVEGGLVFYNSYLTGLSDDSTSGRVSSWGFAVGYLGSITSLLIALPLVRSGRFELVWVATAAFFFIFSLPAFLWLPADDPVKGRLVASARAGIVRTIATFREIVKRRNSLLFLIAYFIYTDGVNTVIVFSSIFAATTIGLKPVELLLTYLVVQATASAGAFGLGRFTDTLGPKRVIVGSLLLWSGVSISAYFVSGKVQFFFLAATSGLGLGVVQAASRALFSRMIPDGKEGEYFGFYSMVGKSSAIVGPLLFGTLSRHFGSQRPAILAVSAFFVIGLVVLGLVKELKHADTSPDPCTLPKKDPA